MARYEIITLVDITRSNADRSETDTIKKGQQANFNSLVQAIGMRSNITWDLDPKYVNGRLPNQDFKSAHWIWEFSTERDEVFFKSKSDPVGLLIDDLNGVPVIARLNNTADINPAAFFTKGENVNTWVNDLTHTD